MKTINAIEASQLVLKADLNEHTKIILEAISKMATTSIDHESRSPKYLRTKDVRKLLHISANKLSDMRFKGEIPFRKIGKTYFYPADRIHSLLK